MIRSRGTPARALAALFLSLALGAVTPPVAADGQPEAGFPAADARPFAGRDALAYALALQPDGAVVVAGQVFTNTGSEIALARYRPDGRLDTTLVDGGALRSDFGGVDNYVYAVAVQPDGKILVAGYTGVQGRNGAHGRWDLAVRRFLPDGLPDKSFGDHGTVRVSDRRGNRYARALALQPDGRIVVAGYGYAGTDQDFLVARFLPDGRPDPGFGAGGAVLVDLGPTDDLAYAVTVQPDGRIVVAGRASQGAAHQWAVVRLRPDGGLDDGFGDGGIARGRLQGLDSVARDVLVQPDGGILVAGFAGREPDLDVALLRLLPDGRPDSAFGTGGGLRLAIGSGNDVAYALGLDPLGRILLAGYSYNGAHQDLLVLRRLADGSPDPAFGTDGTVRVDASGDDDFGRALALTPGGRLLVAGYSGQASHRFQLLRLDNGPALDLTPDALAFAPVAEARGGEFQTSGAALVSGLGDGVTVPLRVVDGQVSRNGGPFLSAGWARNGDSLRLRHRAIDRRGAVTTSTLQAGGLRAADNAALLLGGPVTARFASITTEVSRAGGGGGALGLVVPGLLAFGRWRRRR